MTSRDALRGIVSPDGSVVPIASLADVQDALRAARSDLEVLVERDGRHLAMALPVRTTSQLERTGRLGSSMIVAILLLAIPFTLVRRSSAPAAFPLALFYSGFSVAVVAAIAGRGSTSASIVAVVALVFAPAALFHLAFLFPRETRISREMPMISSAPYVFSAFLAALGGFAIWRTPILWPALLQLLVSIAAAGWMVLIFACVFAVRESESAIERARARIVLSGSLLLPIVPTLVAAVRVHMTPQELVVLYLWSAAATMPLPIALGVGRYNLFDLEHDSRQGVARALYLVVATLVLSGVVWLTSAVWGHPGSVPDSATWLSLCFVCVLALEPVRARMPELLESVVVPKLRALRAVQQELERRLAGLNDQEEILCCVERAVVDGVSCRSGAVFLNEGGPSRLVHAFGEHPPSRHHLADAARGALGAEQSLHLPSLPSGLGSDADVLRKAGVTLVVRVGSGGEEFGLMLLGEPMQRPFYTGTEIEFVRSVAGVVGTALLRARVEAVRSVREREAATGRVAFQLAHDTGKDIGWLRMLAARLAEHPGASPRARRDAATIAELSEELHAAFNRVLEESAHANLDEIERPRFDDLVERTCRRLAGLHGRDRIIETIDPCLRKVRVPESIGRVLRNVLDDALHASSPDDPVHLFATLEHDWIQASIQDRRCGIPADALDRVFEPGGPSRRGVGRTGLGLTGARELAVAVGGSISLKRRHDGGTVATIRLPRAFEADSDTG